MAEKFDLAKEISEINDPKALRVIAYLLERIEVLEEKIARLEKNSSTSSKPPSSDIVKPPHERRQRGREPGGQKGHRGVKHKLLPPEKVDRVVELGCRTCPDCGGVIQKSSAATLKQQVYELVEKPLQVTEYRRKPCFCPRCNAIKYAQLPEGIIVQQQCGIRLQALLAYLKGTMGASYSELKEFCAQVLGADLARSSICNIVMRVSEKLRKFHEKLGSSVKEATRLNIDETSWKRNGEHRWAWVFCNPELAYFSISKRRKAAVPKRVLGKNFSGAITTDFFVSYKYIPKIQHQFCLAHLIREVKFITTLPKQSEKKQGAKLLSFFKKIFEHLHEGRPPDKIKKTVKMLSNYMSKLKPEKGSLRTLLKRIYRTWDSLWRFLDKPTLFSPTNNFAERTLRHLVRLRKISQGSRSRQGEVWTARFCSLYQTAKIRKLSAWNLLQMQMAQG